MITPAQRESWANRLLELTVEILSMLEAGQAMDALDAIELERERLVDALFTDLEPGCVGDGAWIAKLREVQALNEQLVSKAIEERERASQELLMFMRAQKAGSAYANAADDSQNSSLF